MGNSNSVVKGVFKVSQIGNLNIFHLLSTNISFLGILCFCIQLVGCSSSGLAPPTRVKPKIENITGKWKLENTQDFDKYVYGQIQIDLKSDMTFEAKVPDSFLKPLGRTDYEIVDIDGKWEVFQDSRGFCEVTLNISGKFITGIGIEADKPPHRLSRYIGDPDGGNTISFVKVGE